MSLSSGPVNTLPQVQVLAGFGATSQFFPWTDISSYVRSGSISRQSNRLAGPLYQYQAGTLTLNLKNGDGRFDPDNLSGPYVTNQGLQAFTVTFTAADLLNAGAPLTSDGTGVQGSFQMPDNLNGTSANVQCWAAGGGGGSGSNISASAGGGGGGGGEYAQEGSLQVTAGNIYDFTIGLGGSRGSPGAGDGSPGGDTLFPGDVITVHAHGGSGGQHGFVVGTGSNTTATQGAGGTGGLGSGNTTSNPGGTGGPAGANQKGNVATGGGGGGSGGPGGGSGFIGSGGGQPGGTGDGVHITPGGAAITGGGPGGNGGQPNKNGYSPITPPGGGGGGGAGGGPRGAAGAHGQISITYTTVVFTSARTEVLPEVPVRVIAGYALNQTVNFENGIGTWAQTGSSGAFASTAQSLWGQTSCEVNTVGGQPFVGILSELVQMPAPGTVMSASFWVYSPVKYNISGGCAIDIIWFNAAGGQISTDTGTAVTVPASTWTLVTNLNNTPPSNATACKINCYLGGVPAAGKTLWFDQPVVAAGPNCGTFPIFTGYVDSWTDTGIVNPNDPGGPQTGGYQGYSEIQMSASDAFGVFSQATLAQLTNPIDGAQQVTASSPQGSVTVTTGDDAGGRIQLLLSAIGWPASQTMVQTSTTQVQGTDLGDTVLDLIQTAANTDGGDLFVDGTGNVVFNNRANILTVATSTTPQAVFGDRPGTVQADGTELPYAGAQRTNDNTTLFNDIQISPVSGIDPLGPPAVTFEVTDAASIAQFIFPRTYTNSSLIFLFEADAASMASWILSVARVSEDRIDQLTIDPQRDPADLYYQVLARGVTDMIEFWRRPPGMYSPIQRRLYIRGIQHTWDFSAKTWQTVWQVQDVGKYGAFLRLDDSYAGRLDFNAVTW